MKSVVNVKDIYGDISDKNRHIYLGDNGLHIRDIEIEANLPEPVEIGHVSDLHFNYCNQQDLDEISRIDGEFIYEMEKALAQKKALAGKLARISTVCDVLIPSFSKNSSRTADTPRFKSFNDKEFFNSVSSFMEQIKNV